MLQMLRDLVNHKGHADAALLTAMRQNAAAASDPELSELLHHILLANRFWLLLVLGVPFVLEDESRPAASFDGLVQRYARTQAQEAAWFDTATEADLERILKSPLIPNRECSIAQAFMQVCLHSQGDRAQAAKLLRRHGGTPPTTDFIRWLANRPGPEWPATLETEPKALRTFRIRWTRSLAPKRNHSSSAVSETNDGGAGCASPTRRPANRKSYRGTR